MPRERITWPQHPDDESPFDLHISWTGEGGLVQVQLRSTTDQDVTMGAVDLNRYEINQAIKTLRRARDHAYGKDE